MTNETQPGIPEDLREKYARAKELADNGGYMSYVGIAEIPLIERIASLEQELAGPRIHRLRNERLESELSTLRTENARLEAENGRLTRERDAWRDGDSIDCPHVAELATLRAQLLESGSITDEALKQRDEALAKLEQANSEVKLALDVLTIYANPEQIFDTASAIIASRAQRRNRDS